MAVAFRRRILTLLSIDLVCLLLAFCLSAVLVSRWATTRQVLGAYVTAEREAAASSRRGPYGTYTIPDVYVSAIVTGSVTRTFSGRVTLSTLSGTREVAFATVSSLLTQTYRQYTFDTVFTGSTTITGYRNIDSLLSSYTAESSRYQASIDADRAASSVIDGFSSRTAASRSASVASVLSAAQATGTASASGFLSAASRTASSSAAPERRMGAPAAPTAALARRQPAPAPTAAPQLVARAVQPQKRATVDARRNSSSLLLALIVIIMMLFFARCGHVLYIICKLAQDATPSSEAKALLRNLSRKPVLGLLLATTAVGAAFVAVSTVIFLGGNFSAVYGRGVDAAWFVFWIVTLLTSLLSIFGAWQHMPVEDAHWLAQPVGVIDGPSTDEVRFQLPALDSQPNTAYTEPMGEHSPFLPFSVPGVERASAPPTRRPVSLGSLEQQATYVQPPTERRTSGDQPPPAYTARATPCKEHCPPGHTCV